MKVLIACEYSGVVRDAFIARGHDAISCDLLPTESPGPHIQGDVRELLREPWDLVIAHPPCQDITLANLQRKSYEREKAAVDFFLDCLNANAPRVAVENPMPFKAVREVIGEPDCIVQPYQFGDGFRKKTCWWLRGLPPLLKMGDMVDPPRWVQMTNGSGKKGGVATTAKERARFFPGMVAAMAQQWG